MRRLLYIPLLLLLAGCTGGYSFTGASIPVEAKTISIKQFPNYASGDLQITGEITDYSTRASSIGSDDNVATNRFTITIKVSFTNRFDPKTDFDQSFSRFKDYSAERDFSSVEQGLVSEIVTELCEDIFNKSVVNW